MGGIRLNGLLWSGESVAITAVQLGRPLSSLRRSPPVEVGHPEIALNAIGMPRLAGLCGSETAGLRPAVQRDS
jgi:hypothetical protein